MAAPTSQNQVTKFYDAVPASHTQTRELAHEFTAHFIGALPGFAFVATVFIVALGVASWAWIEMSSWVLRTMALGACGAALAIGVSFGFYTWFGFDTLRDERKDVQAESRFRQAELEFRLEQMLDMPLLTDGAGNVGQTPDAFVNHLDEFANRLSVFGDDEKSRSHWLKADGANEDYRFKDGQRISRGEYERIIRALEIRGRRKGRAGERSTPLSEMEG